MANLLSNPNLWVDDAGHTPPSYWNGTSYDFNSGPSGGPIQYIQLVGTAAAGDTCAATFDNLTACTGAGLSSVVAQMVDLNGAAASPYYQSGTDMASVGSWSITTGSLLGGEKIQISANSQFLAYYAYDFTLTPPPDPKKLLCVSPNPNFSKPPVVLVGTSESPPAILSLPQ